MPFDPHPPELRRVVVAEFLAGKSKKALSRDHGVTVGTVRRWTAPASVVAKSPELINEVRKRGEHFHASEPPIVDLWTPVFDMVLALLNSAASVSKVWERPGWLESQGASALGDYIGTVVDKSALILEALERGYELRSQVEQAKIAGRASHRRDRRKPPALGAGEAPEAP